MKKAIENYLSFYQDIVSDFTEKELDFITPKLIFTKVEKNKLYLRQGDMQGKLGFVSTGLLRQYYTDSRGNNMTVDFLPENTFATDYSAFIKQVPSKFNIAVIEESMIIELDFECIQEGYSKYKNYERFGRLITEQILIKRQRRLESFLFNSAEERYITFLKHNPNLFNRISLTQLSSFLGVERQSLSRIRKRISL